MRAAIRFIAEKEGVKLSSAFRVKTDSRCKLLIRSRDIGRSKYMPHIGKKQIDKYTNKGLSAGNS
jgi:hypothetical protein